MAVIFKGRDAKGKKIVEFKWKHTVFTPDKIPATANTIGIKTGSGLYVVDIDDKNNIDAAFKKYVGKTLTIETEKGYHLYFNVDGKTPGSTNEKVKVDTRGDGGLVFAYTTDKQSSYKLLHDVPIIDLPHSLTKKLQELKLLSDKKIIDGGDEFEKYEYEQLEEYEVKELLDRIYNYDDYDTWVKVGMALHNWDHKRGFRLWDKWSSKSDKHDPKECKYKWSTFNDDGEITVGTLIHLAEDISDLKDQPFSLELLKRIGVAVDYEASELKPLDEDEILYDGALHLFYAPSNSFKSFTVAKLAAKTNKQVFYLDFERNPGRLKQFCEDLNITYVTPKGEMDELQKILETKADCRDVMLILDSFSFLIDEGNNDATDTANVVKQMLELTRELRATVVFIDHATKTDYNEKKKWTFKLEGNESGKKKLCDLMYKVQPVSDDYRDGVELMIEKDRSGNRRRGEILDVIDDPRELEY